MDKQLLGTAVAAAVADVEDIQYTPGDRLVSQLTMSMRGTIAAPLPSWKERVDICGATQHKTSAATPLLLMRVPYLGKGNCIQTSSKSFWCDWFVTAVL